MAERQVAVRVNSETVQGPGSWVEVRPLAFGELRRLSDIPSAEEAVSAHVLAWNWVDDEGQSLPPPATSGSLNCLTSAEFWFLFEALTGRKEREAQAESILKNLWTGSGESSWELMEFRLCRDVYHCLPSELAQEDARTILAHLQCMAAEARVSKLATNKKPAARPRSRRR